MVDELEDEPYDGSAVELEEDVYNGEAGHALKHNAVNKQANWLTQQWADRANDPLLSASIDAGVDVALGTAIVQPRYSVAEGAPSLLALKRGVSTIGTASTPGNNDINPNVSFNPGDTAKVAMIAGGGFGTIENGGATYYGAEYVPAYDGNKRDPHALLVVSDAAAIVWQGISAPGHRYRWSIDGKPVGSWFGAAGPGGGAFTTLKLTISGGGTHRVRLDMVGANTYGLIVPQGTTFATPVPAGPKVAVLGCSYEGGSGADYGPFSAYIMNLGPLFGWENIANASIGGTGYVNGHANTYPIAYGDRVDEMLDRIGNPDVVIFGALRNDYNYTTANVATAAAAAVAAVRTALPKAVIIVMGGLADGAPVDGSRSDTWAPLEDAVFAAVAPYGAFTIPATDLAVWTGTGKTGTPGTGNGQQMIQSDGTHPTALGSDRAGGLLAHRIRERLALYFA